MLCSKHGGSLLRQQPGAEVQSKVDIRVLSAAQRMCSALIRWAYVLMSDNPLSTICSCARIR